MIDRVAQEAYEYYYSEDRGPAEPVICQIFGCNRKLTSQEKMFGNKCIRHSTKGAIVMKENLYTPDCIRTFSGKYVNVFEPDPETIVIEDIAHALSHQGRFGGHLPQFYTVAQHSIFCADLAPDEHKFAALMHDASEAYLLDVPRPIKLKLCNYKEIEDKLMEVLATKFGFEFPFDPHIKKVDEEMLRREWYGLMLERGKTFEVYSPQKAKVFFIKQFEKLKAI